MFPSSKEDEMRAAVRRLGNSAGIIIPKSLLAEIGIGAGDPVDLTLDEGRIVVAPVKRVLREGWADASRAIAQSGDDAPVWPEFGNIDDDDLIW
jgi:antitoxin MazE